MRERELGPWGRWLRLLAASSTLTACASGEAPPKRLEGAPEVTGATGDGAPGTADALSGTVPGPGADTGPLPGADAGADAETGPGLDASAPGDVDATPGEPPLEPDAGGTGAGRPSGGAGGPYPGDSTRRAGDVEFVVHVPPGYDPGRALPLVGLFHGQGGSAADITAVFAPTADAGDFLTVAVTSSGAAGGWVGGVDVQRFSLALNDVVTAWNVDLDRLYLWGFSAGAHFVHGIALDNADAFAAYAVVAGALDQYAGTDAPARAVRHIPVQVHIGRADPLYGHATGDRAVFTAAGWVDGQDYRLREFDGGHELRPEHPGEVWEFLRAFSL